MSDKPSLRDLLALPMPLRVGDVTLQVVPMGWYQASRALEHLLPALGRLPLLRMAIEQLHDDDPESLAASAGMLLGLVIEHRDAIAAFCAEASGLPSDDVKRLDPALLLELALGLIEVNADFFARSLPGVTDRAKGRLAALQARLQPLVTTTSAGTTSLSDS